MIEIDITSNIEEVSRELNTVARSQIPFATSLAINATMKDVRRQIVGPTWQKAFNVRNKRFPGVVFRIKFSNKNDLEVVLYDQLGREYLKRHVTGGTKTAHRGGNLAVPINVTRTGGGRIPKSKKPRVISAKKSTRIITGKSGAKLIVERFKGETIVRYALVPSAQINSTFRFYEDAMRVADRVLNGHWNSGMQRALSTLRNFDLA